MSQDVARQQQLRAAVGKIISRAREANGVPGIVAGVSVRGERLVAVTGDADTLRKWPLLETSRFGIGCLTKLLSAVVVTHLVQVGSISLDVPIDGEAIGLSPSFAARKITLRHLLTHTAGFRGPSLFGVAHRQFEWKAFCDQLSESEQMFVPGSVFNYENTGHVIVGEVIRQITGRSLPEHIRALIFSPLEICSGTPLSDFKSNKTYVAPHRFDDGVPKSVAPSAFGPFWGASLADVSLSIDDLLKIGEAVVGSSRHADFSWVRKWLSRREISLPMSVSGLAREHAPAFFNTVCAEYGSGWFGYAGSAPGQTCGMRFDPQSRTVCVVAMNAWVPVLRDELLDKLCGSRSHPQAGEAGGIVGVKLNDVLGKYSGGGNIFRSAEVRLAASGKIECEVGSDGPILGTLCFELDNFGQLVPDKKQVTPGIGFFREPFSGRPCLLVGLASLKKVVA